MTNELNFVARAKLAWRILRARHGNLLSHAESELSRLLPPGDTMNDAMRVDALEMVLLFSTQGHSGFSAGYARGLLDQLLAFKPLTPLTGADDEWVMLNYGGDMVAQNKRCSHVFRRTDGTAYDSQGRVFEEPSGARFTSADSRVEISFPYTPTTEIVKVPEPA